MTQLALTGLLPKTDWRAPKVSELPSWQDAKRVAFDLETCDPDLKEKGPGIRTGAYIIGYSFAIEYGPSHYVPIKHGEGTGFGNVEDPEAAMQYLRDQSRVFDGELVGANLPYELDFSWEAGCDWSKCTFYDVQIADPLIYEHEFSYSLDNIAKRRGIEGKDETLMKQAYDLLGLKKQGKLKSQLWRMPAQFVGGYAERDATLPLEIRKDQLKDIEKQDLWDVLKLESELLPVLVRMTRRGVAINEKKLDIFEKWAKKEQLDKLAEIKYHTGISLTPEDLNASAALAPVCKYMGITLPKTEKTGKDSVTIEVLESTDHPAAKALLGAKRMVKILGTYVNGTRKFLVKGRIHSSFNALKRTKEHGDTRGTISGRLSSDNPNAQNQPSRHPLLGPVWRSMFEPDFGEWCCSDWSQQEPRLTVHYAEELDLEGAKLAASRYREDPLTDSHQMMADIIGMDRSPAKTIFLALCYDMGGAKLCRDLGYPTKEIEIQWGKRKGEKMEVAGPEGEAVIQKFHAAVPFVKELAEICKRKVQKRGWIRCLDGRVIHFPKDKNTGRFWWARKGLNRLIQGGAGGQSKKAMVAADRAGFHLQIQVHDELDASVHDAKEAAALGVLMQDIVPLRVPMKVDVDCGPSWGEISPRGREVCREFWRARNE